MPNNDLDDVLAMLDKEEEETPKRKPAQQTLRDRMLNESKNSEQYDEDVDERERELDQEIIDEEVEEENKPGINPKIIIAAIVVVVLILVLVISSAISKKKAQAEAEAQAQAEAEAQAQLLAQQQAEQENTEAFEQPSNWGATTYTDDEIIKLRNLGMTAEGINSLQQNKVPFDYVYYTYLEQYYAWQLDNQLPILDTASPDFKEYIDDTWLSLNKRLDVDGWTSDYIANTYQDKRNFDYEKVEPYGNQLFLKIYLDADEHTTFFLLNISPDEWNQLDDKGNVVVDYTYVTHYLPAENVLDQVEDMDNIFITSAQLDIIESLKLSKTKEG